MDLQRSFTVCRRWWWVVLGAMLVTLVSAAVLIGSPKPTYESTSTLVIQPKAVSEDSQVRALAALVQGSSVSETYASIARSKLIGDRAKSDAGHRAGTSIGAETIVGTRLVRITVQASDAEYARALAASVRDETVSYVGQLGDSFRLEPLDPPKAASHPLPTRRSVTLALAGVLGLLLGIVLAFAAETIWPRRTEEADPFEPDAGTALWTPPTGVADALAAPTLRGSNGTRKHLDQPA